MVARGLSEAKPLWREGGRTPGSARRRPAGGRWPLWRPEGRMEGGRELREGGGEEGIAGERE